MLLERVEEPSDGVRTGVDEPKPPFSFVVCAIMRVSNPEAADGR
jgi:hypothetical protein